MYKIFLISFLSVFITTISTTAFEDSNTNDIKLNYKLNVRQFELQLDYCNSPDSFIINKLYSEKKIELNYLDKLVKKKNRVIVNIKTKPINTLIIEQGYETAKISSFDLVFIDAFNFENFSNSKQDFIKTLLPLISYENQKILLERKNLLNIKETLVNEKTLNNRDLVYLKKIAKKYKIKINNKHKIDLVNKLLIFIDIIPNSIVLAQAANESGWGTSRFAKEYNALFGEYTYDFSKGVIPLKREEGKKHLVKAFSSYDNSVKSYFRNINTHYAYEKFRLTRKLMRDKNNFSNINLLVDTLNTYAEDNDYVETISSIIESNKLSQFDIINYTPSKS